MSARATLAICYLLALLEASAGDLAWFSPDHDLSASARIVPDVRGRCGQSGFSFVAEFACTNEHYGPIVSKPGVFELAVSGAPDNRLYVFRMFGTRTGYPDVREVELKVNAETDPGEPVRVAGVCVYYHEPEQANVGYRLSLHVNGEMAGSRCCDRFVPGTRTQEPVVFAQGVDVRRVGLCARACSPYELFPSIPCPDGGRFGNDAIGSWLAVIHHRAERNIAGRSDAAALAECFGKSRGLDVAAWNSAQKGVHFLETPELVVAVATGRVIGNPVLGAWNRTTGCALLADDGLAWGLEYTDEDNQKKTPVMIHRAPFGSMERFCAVLIEHTSGHFPLWLTPDQVAILPLSEKYNDYAKEVAKKFDLGGVRPTIDLRNEKLGRKIRDNELKRIPYMVIVGEKEEAEGLVSMRQQGGGEQTVKTI